MSKTKRILLIFSVMIVAAILLFVVVNFFDESPRPGLYTEKDLRPATLDNSNGYYILWGLAEPLDVDVQSDGYTKDIRQLFEPGPNRAEYVKNFDSKKYKGKYSEISKPIRLLKFPKMFNESWITMMEQQPEELAKAMEAGSDLLKRYDDMMTAPVFEDFTDPAFSSPIPNLLAWLHTGRLYTAVHTAEALKGNWDASAQALLKQTDFIKKANANSRTLITNLIAKAIMNMSLQGLASIMNHPDCPETVYPIVLAGMPDLKYEEYGSRNAFITECLSSFSIVDGAGNADIIDHFGGFNLGKVLPNTPFLNKNRTKNYFFDYYSMLIAADAQEPHLWTKYTLGVEKESLKTRSPFWWFRNPVGKVIFDIAMPNIVATIAKGYRVRAYYEMVRIMAEFRMNYSPDEPVQDILNGLKSYKSLDPCSGKPYAWNADKKVLYSFGIDCKDQKGIEKIGVLYDTDYAIHIVLH